MTAFADAFPTLARHWTVLRASWRDRKEVDRRQKLRSDHAFLPAALEIIEQPPSPGARWLLLAICGLFVIALGWALIGQVDVVAVAPGKTIPAGNAKVIQSIEIGGVRAIYVANGQFVRRGQLLIELDPTLARAEEAQSTQTLQTARIVQARNNALLAYLAGRPARFVAPPGTPAQVVSTEETFVRTAIAEYEAQSAALRQQRAEKAAQFAGAQAEIAKLRETLPYIERQLAARAELSGKGYYSKLKLLEYEQLRAEHIRTIDVQRANAQGARAAMGTLDAQLRSLRENFGKAAVGGLAEANDKAGLAAEELRKTERRRRYQELRSPVDGVVQQLAVTTVGGVVQAAQPLMVIVPCAAGASAECGGAVEVETFVQNRDVGFVRPGQRVAVKLEAFDFTDYGLIEGRVEWISRDAIDQDVAGRADRMREATPQLVYAARVRLDCTATQPDRSPLCDRVRPGMAVQAEIKTGRRRIIRYLLSPISQTVSEAGRDR